MTPDENQLIIIVPINFEHLHIVIKLINRSLVVNEDEFISHNVPFLEQRVLVRLRQKAPQDEYDVVKLEKRELTKDNVN